MNTVLRDLPYGPGPRQLGDLHLPARRAPGVSAAPVLLIHGGGWNSLSKESLDPVARLLVEEGRAVFSINYRLLSQAPFPACRDDCLAAARHLLAGGLAREGLPAPVRLLVCGASAGGHLAFLVGLALGARDCAGILSLAGPSRVVPATDDTAASAISAPDFFTPFFGTASPAPAALLAATPGALAHSSAPPLVCIHSTADRLVPISHSSAAIAAWTAAGADAELIPFDGLGEQHGFWTCDDHATRQLIPAVDSALRRALRRLA